MEALSNELLRDILDQVEGDPDRTVPIDRRAYLSVESFAAPTAPAPAQAQDIAHFRLVCRRFGDLGIPYQFTRVTTRFSKAGFTRLERIASRPAIARHVKKFSYMLPCFYVQGWESVKEMFDLLDTGPLSLDAGHFIRKARDQEEIVNSMRDVAVLKHAASAFTSLQHVQILRLQDEADRLLWEYIREDWGMSSPFVELKWMPACLQATKALGEALLKAESPCSRFSGPMMNPQSLLVLQENPPHLISDLASRLTCLELHFDEGVDLDSRMRGLAPLFKTVFVAATGMLAVHVGFPSRAPVSLKLDAIFHHVRWERLRAFGIQAWRLDADEVIALARRHRKSLRGLRLRDVLLKDGSRWKTVLGMLRDEMELLDWVSLRRIGYARTFDEQFAGTMEVPPDPPGGGSDSDVDDGFPTHLSNDDVDEAGASDDDDSDDASRASSANDDHGPEANELAMDPDTPSSAPWCSCGGARGGQNAATADELGDNGQWVGVPQRKMWEKWVVGRCAEHS
ncbi:MAG: hypothetical protein M1832_000851 [Thelocarpon impressellum]|nr:MAG: hypothetical protein M1832_000851 [Thelocarpon impressellum]